MWAVIGVTIAAVAAVAQGSGEFEILHSSPGVQFSGEQPLNLSFVKEIYSAALGFTPSQKPPWHGLSIKIPFFPEAIVAVALEGVDSFNDGKSTRFPLIIDEDEEFMWQYLTNRVQERNPNKSGMKNKLIRINLKDGVNHLGTSALGELKTIPVDESKSKPLSMENDVDRKFLEEMQLLKAIAINIPSTTEVDNSPDIYWFVVSSLGKIVDTYGKDSPAASKASHLLKETLAELSEAFKKAYKNEVLITAFSSNGGQIRQTRSAPRVKRDVSDSGDITGTTENKLEDSSPSSELTTKYEPKSIKPEKINVYKGNNENFPVIFNICFWFVVAFFFSLLAICIFIADMDPGRDSIIYRMTSNRMKKDN